ncbi:Protein of unknown function [Bacillus cereus]|nr:Protein of unknown function [Bacillus cereus]SCN36786.1 Protein of unknown function [Bacillus wiedmannii]
MVRKVILEKYEQQQEDKLKEKY